MLKYIRNAINCHAMHTEIAFNKETWSGQANSADHNLKTLQKTFSYNCSMKLAFFLLVQRVTSNMRVFKCRYRNRNNMKSSS